MSIEEHLVEAIEDDEDEIPAPEGYERFARRHERLPRSMGYRMRRLGRQPKNL
jgi:hypothetical protein